MPPTSMMRSYHLRTKISQMMRLKRRHGLLIGKLPVLVVVALTITEKALYRRTGRLVCDGVLEAQGMDMQEERGRAAEEGQFGGAEIEEGGEVSEFLIVVK